MLIQGSCNTQKTNALVQKYIDLASKGVGLNQILVINLNPFKRANFINKILEINPSLRTEKHNILTFWGLCYNAFQDNWDYISNLINNEEGANANLCGLEVSQFIFKQSIKEADFSDYISKVNLLHQLFRRYSLIVQNCLTNKEIEERSILLKESFYKEAQKAIDDYKLKTIKYKSFDYLRQLATLPSIYKNTDYFKNIKYLLIDDADEYPYAFWCFVEYLIPQLKDYLIAYDKNGSSRCGYLCAYKSGIEDFIKRHSPEVTILEDKSTFFNFSNKLYENIKSGNKLEIKNHKFITSFKRLDMFEKVFEEVSSLINKGIKPNEISIISPLSDEVLIENFEKPYNNIKFQILSGSEKLNQNKIIRQTLTILKLLNNVKIHNYELKGLLIDLLKIPHKKCIEVLKEYKESQTLTNTTFKEQSYDYAYKKLLALIEGEKKAKNSISNQIKIIFSNLINEFEPSLNKEKYDFLIKEATSFETAFGNLGKEFITQIENSVISENPIDSFSLNKSSIIVATPQKIIDYSIKTKIQIWLDLSNNEWLKQDTGTLYNAWVLNRDWNKDKYTLEDEIYLTREKTARIIRKLTLCAQENILFFSSIYDNTGNENFGGLTDYIAPPKDETKKEFKIIPREDQKGVLEYKSGKMGIMAVPGAGKTTILLALIIKMLNEGIKPENIFVLTYMESAAKNFKDRIKLAMPENAELPNISTIHGLALRIIKENGNHNKLGLDENFEICDDNTKEKIIKELFYKLKIEDEKYDNYLKCISIVKLSNTQKELLSKYKEVQDFFNFFDKYNAVLKQHNYIDYDDMLCYAVTLLEKNPEIKKYYQNICKYIIEDEAQDSTEIQQKLISLLNKRANNLVRCGDINQAITTTFTNSNPEGFKHFIKDNQKVEMNSSQRCAEPIYSFANKLIKEISEKTETKNAFYPIEIKGTEKNPPTKTVPSYTIFEKETEERLFILNKVIEILKEEPKATIAILLRLNSQVNEYNELFVSNNIKTAVRTDCLSQKKIYKLIYAVLKTINNPLSNNQILELANEYKRNNIYNFDEDDFNFIKTLKTPFFKLSPDEIQLEGLMQLYWDIDYWLNNSSTDTDILALNIGKFYAKNTTDNSNSYMVSTIIKRINNKDSLEDLLKKLEYAASKAISAYKFFEDENANTNENPISIMTMHKSKGDEFDYVFIPELNEENYATSSENVKLKTGTHFIQTIKNFVDNKTIKTSEELKQEQVNETLRLLYVGITRAKKELHITSAKNYKRRKNVKTTNIIERLVENS